MHLGFKVVVKVLEYDSFKKQSPKTMNYISKDFL